MADTKQAYVSPPAGTLDITVIRDANPRVTISLDLGIPNFTVFSMTFPLVEGQPGAMSGLIGEAIQVLLDEVATFMLSMDYDEAVIVTMYATVLAAYKGMSSEADSSKDQDEIGSDPHVKTFEGTFSLPAEFVNETQKRVVTAASGVRDRLLRTKKRIEDFLNDPRRVELVKNRHSRRGGEALHEYQWEEVQRLVAEAAAFFRGEGFLFEDQSDAMYDPVADIEEAKRQVKAAEDCVKHGVPGIAHNFEEKALLYSLEAIQQFAKKEDPKTIAEEEMIARHFKTLDKSGATKVKRLPKARHVELTYDPKPKTTVNDAARVIRQYRNRSLKQQPKPLYVIVYDQMGRPTGTLSLGPQFKNKLLQLTQKRSSVEFTSPLSFTDELALKNQLLQPGIPEAISVGGMTYRPEGVAGADMALYHGPQDWLVKFPDGRSAIFPGRPTFRNMRRLNFPVPRNRFKWTILRPAQSINPESEAATKAENQTTQSEVKGQ